ncbi:phage/plasmid replication protein, II/X family [Acinetobacter johnsonii]|uniref:phage/plasmid replication protein, II/X family n=1 Tax=Acinetobacter johnsonii TaxID=40214 RepID=UPI00244AFC98|nr:phage/plasmid replication protein, II/X family [Acinetobacter johnsonii]MDH1520023.1 phage/plasmid replication protein, II/X family [Acinetobacter johnsonii]
MKKNNNYEIDWIDFDLFVDGNAEKITEGSILYTTLHLDTVDDVYKLSDQNCQIKFKPKIISSDKGKTVTLTYKKDYIHVSGNIYKWLKSQNVTGEKNLLNLIVEFVNVLKSKDLISFSEEQFKNIKNGNFRVYRVDVKLDYIFASKQDALRYLNNVQMLGYFPYKAKQLYKNGCYFGMSSKTRWSLKYYHKGNELREKNQRFSIEPKIYEIAERMVRAECKILNAQLKDWNLMYASQWNDLEKIRRMFDDVFSKLKLPKVDKRNNILDIENKSDRKFITLYEEGCISDYYSRTMIHLKKKKILNEYGIDLNIKNEQRKLLK